VVAILRHFHLPTTAAPLSPARRRPQPHLDLGVEHALEIYQTPASDPTEPEPVPDLEGDRTMP
jgi:hypothetical protein